MSWIQFNPEKNRFETVKILKKIILNECNVGFVQGGFVCSSAFCHQRALRLRLYVDRRFNNRDYLLFI